MADRPGKTAGLVAAVHAYRGLILPIVAAGLIFAMLVPIPPALMNVLLVGNIALAAVILLTTIYVASPLEFSVFPSLLLGATLVRLVLNVATTRLILTAGQGGRSLQEAQFAAGEVIWTFSHFVTAGSLEVGVILFAIIAIVQFVVITKGAARISEVAARFVLDAMPGKQMAIDADLNAKLIDESQAHARREEISRQADFYGAMDGASKFLRGEAVAAVIITLVNILGGLYVGLVRYGWSFQQTLGLFTKLTIGDGLVTQIPAFIVSISAALIVTRSTSRSNLGEEVIRQLTCRPVALVITAAFLIALTVTSLPKIPLLILGLGCAGLAWLLARNQTLVERAHNHQAEQESGESDRPQPQSNMTVDPIRLEIGYGLVGLVDGEQAGKLLDRLQAVREEIADQLGLTVPSIKIVDDMKLRADAYAIKLRGVKIAGGRLHPRRLLAVADNRTIGRLEGMQAIEPATQREAIWIGKSDRHKAEMLNYTVLSPAEVLAGHVAEVVRRHAARLLTRQQTSQLLEELKSTAPNVVAEATDKLTLGKMQKILQNLLSESVPIRDLESILEAACDAADQTDDPAAMTELVRLRLARMLTQQYCAEDGKVWCVALDPELAEEIARQAGSPAGRATAADVPAKTKRISEALAEGLARLTRHGRQPVVLCEAKLRVPVRQLVADVMPAAAVLAYNEIESAEIQSVGSVGIE